MYVKSMIKVEQFCEKFLERVKLERTDRSSLLIQIRMAAAPITANEAA